MDIKKCKLFVLTAETRKISKTAELTGYSQSGVSHILKDLEKEVGATLFKRDRYGVHLTPIGADLLMYIKRFLAENDRLEQFIYDLHGLEVGTIKIGTYTSVAGSWLPLVIRRFHDVHPNVELIIKEGGANDLSTWLSDYEIDLAFYSFKTSLEHEFIHLMDDPMVAVLPPDYPVSSQDVSSFRISDFNGQPFILSETGTDHDIDRILSTTQTNPNIKFSSKEDATILSMVEQGIGLSILPELSCTARPGKYKTLPLEPHFYRNLGIGIRSLENSPPIVRSFIYTVQSILSGRDWQKR